MIDKTALRGHPLGGSRCCFEDLITINERQAIKPVSQPNDPALKCMNDQRGSG
jgi:hypothetical protein